MAGPAGDSLETALYELYGSDPADFVATRKQIAARLRTNGARDVAKAVAAARRPSAAAAALNRLARERPEVITSFLERSTDLRDSFRVSRDEVRAATAAHRDALRIAIDAALANLSGRANAYRAQIQSTLHAAGLDPDVAHLLRTGRLEKEVMGPSGFGESELPDLPATAGTPPAPQRRHLRLAPTPETADATATDARPSELDDESDERQRAEAERAAHLAAERERIEREQIERVEAVAREQRRAGLHAALAAAEAETTSATTDLETAHQTERDLHGQLQAAKEHSAVAKARVQAARAAVAALEHQLEDEPDRLAPS